MRKLKLDGYQWNSMRNDISNFINSYPICQRITTINKINKFPGQRYTVKSTAPNIIIGIDIIGPITADSFGYKYILIVVDAMSRFVD